jgi:hypothetical protein
MWPETPDRDGNAPKQAPEQATIRLKGLPRLLRGITWSGLLTELMQASLLFAVLALPISALFREWQFILWPWLAVGWFATWLVRLNSRYIWPYFLVGVALFALPLLLRNLIGMPLYLAVSLAFVLLIFTVRAFVQRVREDQVKPHMTLSGQVFALALLFCLDLIADALNMPGLVQGYFYFSIFYLLAAVLRWHNQSLVDHLGRFMLTPTQPTARIIRSNRRLLLAFAGVLVLILALSPGLRLHEIVPWLGRQLLLALGWLLKILLSLIPQRETDPTLTDEPTETIGPLPDNTQETPMWLQVLWTILQYVAEAAFVLIILGGLVYGVIVLYRRFYARRQSGPDILESILPDFGKDIRQRLDRTASRWQQMFSTEPEIRIRKLYGRLIPKLGSHYKTFRLDDNLTARQISEQLDGSDPGLLLEITQLYEKARYGGNACTGSDVHRMQKLCRECMAEARST